MNDDVYKEDVRYTNTEKLIDFLYEYVFTHSTLLVTYFCCGITSTWTITTNQGDVRFGVGAGDGPNDYTLTVRINGVCELCTRLTKSEYNAIEERCKSVEKSKVDNVIAKLKAVMEPRD